MAKGHFIYDDSDLGFRKGGRGVGGWMLEILKFIAVSLLLAAAYYAVYALVVWNDQDLRLHRENRTYSRIYPSLSADADIIEDEVRSLHLRDEEIYQAVFHTSAPSMADLSETAFSLDGDASDDALWSGSRHRLDGAVAAAGKIEANFRNITDILVSGEYQMPPLTLPVKNFSVARTGASVGQKVSPFYKVGTAHNGLDIIAPAGTPVYATAPGTVVGVVRSGQSLGNMVVINHNGGCSSRYAHLSDIRVSQGMKVNFGTLLGYVGVSGQSYAPHLHYEVVRDTLVCNPVDYFFASVTPQQYADMLILSSQTEQSLD